MKNVLILHGAGNNSSGNWFPWLKTALENKGYQVVSPDLPNADNPKTSEWIDAVKASGFEFNEDSVLIGHSSGGTLILKILEDLPEGIKIDKAILVAAPLDKGSIEKYWPLKEGIADRKFNWEKIRNSAKEFVLIYSDNDPYDCGIRHGETIAEKTGGKLIVKKGEGHFNLEAGEKYKKFPLLIELVD